MHQSYRAASHAMPNNSSRVQRPASHSKILKWKIRWILLVIIVVILIAVGIAVPTILIVKKKATLPEMLLKTTTEMSMTLVTTMKATVTSALMLEVTTELGQTTKRSDIMSSMKWKQDGITVVKPNGGGPGLDEIGHIRGFELDHEERMIYLVDFHWNRIMKWGYYANSGELVVGATENGDDMNHLLHPIDVIIDKENDSLIICDMGNRQVVRWPRRNGTKKEIIISDVECNRLTRDKEGNIYISEVNNHQVTRWKVGETNGVVVAGGNRQGNQLNQLNRPAYIVVDQNHSVYVSDTSNHRVMKWIEGATEGIIVAGGFGAGDRLEQLQFPGEILVDRFDNVYVADRHNQRIMRWLKGSTEGSVIVGGNGQGNQPNQFDVVEGLSFDSDYNLYVLDNGNSRIQKFELDMN